MAQRSAPNRVVEVCVEATAKRAFASALAWPGWCRSGRDEDAALAALRAYRPRYEVVARAAGVAVPVNGELVVTERSPGTATTQFGAPDVPAEVERQPLSAVQAQRMAALVTACWTVLDAVVAGAPPVLRKGPRGGGRDRDAIAAHVVAAEAAYARKIGVRTHPPQPSDVAPLAGWHAELMAALEEGARTPPAQGWPPRYAARRIGWHVLDHAWEIEDRSDV